MFGFCPAGSTSKVGLMGVLSCGRNPVNCSMTSRCLTSLLALGLLIQGCTIQKRSVLPGWHVERAGRVLDITSSTSPETFARAEMHGIERLDVCTPMKQVPVIPPEAMMVHLPPTSLASGHQKPIFMERNIGRNLRPGNEAISAKKRVFEPESSDEDSSWLVRTFMGLLALALDLASVPLFSLGFWYGSWALGMFMALGLGALWLSWFAWRAAFPNVRARARAKNNWQVKQERKEEKRQARNNEPWWLKNLPLTVLVATAVVFILSLSL